MTSLTRPVRARGQNVIETPPLSPGCKRSSYELPHEILLGHAPERTSGTLLRERSKLGTTGRQPLLLEAFLAPTLSIRGQTPSECKIPRIFHPPRHGNEYPKTKWDYSAGFKGPPAAVRIP